GSAPEPPEPNVCWSSTTFVGETQKAWVVQFDDGYVTGTNHNNKLDARAVRCVRGGL
ncbi:MAG: DUF1566 domain-containing protein, partial [Deltaproteobacteria bacterium]|nr:DUF1566 domain-containing protein [Deltaproteobacteria bacterium]